MKLITRTETQGHGVSKPPCLRGSGRDHVPLDHSIQLEAQLCNGLPPGTNQPLVEVPTFRIVLLLGHMFLLLVLPVSGITGWLTRCGVSEGYLKVSGGTTFVGSAGI